jgi:predicted aspartyl protease
MHHRLPTRVGAVKLAALVDSGSRHCFIAESSARRLGLTPSPRPGLTVGVANGERVPLAGVCQKVPITIHDEQFITDMHTINLHGY